MRPAAWPLPKIHTSLTQPVAILSRSTHTLSAKCSDVDMDIVHGLRESWPVRTGDQDDRTKTAPLFPQSMPPPMRVKVTPKRRLAS